MWKKLKFLDTVKDLIKTYIFGASSLVHYEIGFRNFKLELLGEIWRKSKK